MSDQNLPASESAIAQLKAARDRGRSAGKTYREYMRTSTRGLEVGVGVAVGAAVGAWLDNRYGTGPWCALGGVLLGVAHAVKVLVEIVAEEKKRSAAQKAATEAAHDG